MLRDSDLHDLFQGQIVHLTPHTKTASRTCHERRVVRIMHDKPTIRKHWPMIVVEWKQDGKDMWERVHRDNINLRPNTRGTRAEKAEGDGTQGTSDMGRWARVRKLPGRPKPIALAEDEEQGTLF